MITAAARSGTFNTVKYDGLPLAPDFGPDASGSFRDHVAGGLFRNISYTATTVELQNLRALQGDTDGDQDVDLSDYTRLATNFAPGGSGLTWTDGDFDFDGDIDLSDYNRLTGNFNPGGYTTLAGVPEPTSLVLIVAGLLVLVGASPGPHRNR